MSTFFKEKRMSSVESDDALKPGMRGRDGKYADERSLGQNPGAGFLCALA